MSRTDRKGLSMQTTNTGPVETILTEYRHVRETPALETADGNAIERHDNALIDRLTELAQAAASITPATSREWAALVALGQLDESTALLDAISVTAERTLASA